VTVERTSDEDGEVVGRRKALLTGHAGHSTWAARELRISAADTVIMLTEMLHAPSRYAVHRVSAKRNGSGTRAFTGTW
jgi:hypothetical protein